MIQELRETFAQADKNSRSGASGAPVPTAAAAPSQK